MLRSRSVTQPIPFHRPSITQVEQDAVASVLRSGWLTTGPKVKELEATVAKYVASPKEVAATDADPGAGVAPVRHWDRSTGNPPAVALSS